jgi:ActR/RegA family two-component response regulator
MMRMVLEPGIHLIEKPLPTGAVPMTENHILCRVLLIDDSAEMRAVIRRALAGDGYRIDDVATVAEARALDPYSYQAIVTDERIGLERGTDFVREMITAAPEMAGRCLVITGGSLDAIPEGVAWLAKPFGPDELLAAVGALIRTGEPDGQASAGGQGKALLGLVRLVRMRERQDLAERLHDGPVQALSAATLELHMMRGRQKAAQADPLELAIQQVSQAAMAMRSLMREQERGGLTGGDTRLAPAIRDQTARLLTSPAAVDIDPPQPELPAEQVSLTADVAELMLCLLIGDSPPPSAHLSVQVTNEAIRIDAAVTIPGGSESAQRQLADPAEAHAGLRDLAAALAATVKVVRAPDGARVQLTLPRGSAG